MRVSHQDPQVAFFNDPMPSVRLCSCVILSTHIVNCNFEMYDQQNIYTKCGNAKGILKSGENLLIK